MQVTIHTASKVAQDLKEATPKLAESQHIIAVLKELGLTLTPLHPDSSDPELAKHFYVSVSSNAIAEEVSRRLSQSKAVEAVYAKPKDAPPT